MITISINPQTPAHMAILGKALLAMLEGDANPRMLVAATPLPSVDELFPLPKRPAKPAAKIEAIAVAVEPVLVPAVVVATPAPAPVAITLESVRAKLTALSQAGQGAAVKEIITAQGCTRLTDILPDQYAAVLAQAEALTA